MYNNAVQALYFGLHCSAIEVTTLWFKQPFCFYSGAWDYIFPTAHSYEVIELVKANFFMQITP